MSRTQHFVRLKAAAGSRIEIQVGDIHLSANAGQVVKVNPKQLRIAIDSGLFVKALKPATPAATPMTPAPAE